MARLSLVSLSHLCNLSESATFFSEVDNYSATTVLSLLHCFFNPKCKVGAARADIRAEHIAAVALGRRELMWSY